MGFNTLVHGEQGGAQLTVESGGIINVKTGGALQFNGTDLTNQAKNSLAAMVSGALATGKKLAFGEVTLDGANPTPVATGLATIACAMVIQKSASTPGDDPSGFTVDYTGSDGTLNVYAWKNTGGTDPTLVASTNATAVLCWIALGT